MSSQGLEHSFMELRYSQKNQRGHQDPFDLADEHRHTARSEEWFNADWRNFDGPPGKEVSPINKRGEERDAEPTVSQRIEKTVRSSYNEEIENEHPPACAKWISVFEEQQCHKKTQSQCERQ